MHIQKYFPDRPILVFAGSEIEFVPPDNGFLRVPITPTRKWTPLGQISDEALKG